MSIEQIDGEGDEKKTFSDSSINSRHTKTTYTLSAFAKDHISVKLFMFSREANPFFVGFEFQMMRLSFEV